MKGSEGTEDQRMGLLFRNLCHFAVHVTHTFPSSRQFDFNILLFMVLCGKSQIFIPALSPNLREMVFKLVVVFALITSHKTMQYILIWLTLTNFYGVSDCSQDCDFMPFTKGAGSLCQTEQVVGY